MMSKEMKEVLDERQSLSETRLKELIEELQERIEAVENLNAGEMTETEFLLDTYFIRQFRFVSFLYQVYDYCCKGGLRQDSLEQLRELNQALYRDVIDEAYDDSSYNPVVCEKELGEYGQILCVLAAELRGMIAAAFEKRQEELVIRVELLLEMYGVFETAGAEGVKADLQDLKDIFYWYISDYTEVILDRRVCQQVQPLEDFATRIIMDSDLSDNRYLYYYGEYITAVEEKTADYLRQLPEETIKLIADTYTEGYRIGFELAKKDLSKKKTVNIRYHIGFERVVKYAIENFKKMGLSPVIYRQASSVLEGKGLHPIGFYGANPNKQYDYDHKDDLGLVWDKKYQMRKLECLKAAYEEYKELAYEHAGPAVIETFGEKEFNPVNKPQAIKLSDKQQKLLAEYSISAGQIVNEYIKGEERSFTIIAFPTPDIGGNFEQVFDETIRINTLDYTLYRDMQQRLIDVLDEADYVLIKGKGNNQTNLKVKLHTLENPKTQTNFENCVADVNIPVGEVFTSPVLAGTEGILHVTRVYLNELKYDDLKITFEDGMISDYTCGNFASEEENKKFLKDTVLHHHDSLPLGEFAIGTNTTAYVAAKKLQIEDKLPILIAEKMGPHFAVGDTCYSHSEDIAVFNPDGKEIIARDNERSILRKEDMQKAYFGCHTDITIPYDELGELSVVRRDNSVEVIIEDGRFVLEGLEKLNEPFGEDD